MIYNLCSLHLHNLLQSLAFSLKIWNNYNTDFLLSVKLGEFSVFSRSDHKKMSTKMFHHPPLSLENYICDVGKNTTIWNNSQNSTWRV